MRSFRLFASSAVLPLAASGGSMFAWTKWRVPLAAPAAAKPTGVRQLLAGFGTAGPSSSVGLRTTHGTRGFAFLGGLRAFRTTLRSFRFASPHAMVAPFFQG